MANLNFHKFLSFHLKIKHPSQKNTHGENRPPLKTALLQNCEFADQPRKGGGGKVSVVKRFQLVRANE